MKSAFAHSATVALAGLAAANPAVLVAGTIASVDDLGLASGFQDTFLGHHKRGRALIAADFDLDGRIDFYLGNPRDECFILRNVSTPEAGVRFEMVEEVLLSGELAWGAVAFDYDNDGDYDLFVSIGGNEGIGFDYLLKNLFLETGSLTFEDVTGIAGVAGPVPPGGTEPIPTASANAVVADYDLDGDVDLFVNGNVKESDSLPQLKGRNTLWRNEGDGTFVDVTEEVGLAASLAWTRHSTFFDYDNDGDPDLYESNYIGYNVLWQNMRRESGSATFEDVTAKQSAADDDLRFPYNAFASAAADFNNDGWEDLIVFTHGGDGPWSPYGEGHLLFLNQGGEFTNIANATGLNAPYIGERGVMGCQVGDLDMDGTPDVYIGNGGPTSGGQYDQLYLSLSAPGEFPSFANESHWVDHPAPEDGVLVYPGYPYRTHGTAFVDVDEDGLLELAVSNGGHASGSEEVREPNRLFKFVYLTLPGSLTVRVSGNGSTVSRDAIGTRFKLIVRDTNGESRAVHRTLRAGSAFSAQNGFEVSFGLGDALSIRRLRIDWPDGSRTLVTEGLQLGAVLRVDQAEAGSGSSPETVPVPPGE